MLPPTVIVFDLDGTLIDSRGDIVAAVNHALAQSGRTPLPGPLIVRYVGDGARSLLARAARLPEASTEVTDLVHSFVEYYCAHPVDFTRWTPGAQEVLEVLGELSDVALAICTNKPRQPTEVVLAALGIRDRFRAVVAGGDTPDKKPSAGPLLLVAKLLDAQADTMVMVGDGPQDVECARRAQVRSIGIDSGFAPGDKLINARPDVLLRSLSDLPEVIDRWRAATVKVVLPVKKG